MEEEGEGREKGREREWRGVGGRKWRREEDKESEGRAEGRGCEGGFKEEGKEVEGERGKK